MPGTSERRRGRSAAETQDHEDDPDPGERPGGRPRRARERLADGSSCTRARPDAQAIVRSSPSCRRHDSGDGHDHQHAATRRARPSRWSAVTHRGPGRRRTTSRALGDAVDLRQVVRHPEDGHGAVRAASPRASSSRTRRSSRRARRWARPSAAPRARSPACGRGTCAGPRPPTGRRPRGRGTPPAGGTLERGRRWSSLSLRAGHAQVVAHGAAERASAAGRPCRRAAERQRVEAQHVVAPEAHDAAGWPPRAGCTAGAAWTCRPPTARPGT